MGNRVHGSLRKWEPEVCGEIKHHRTYVGTFRTTIQPGHVGT
jgi:hypothetical protein